MVGAAPPPAGGGQNTGMGTWTICAAGLRQRVRLLLALAMLFAAFGASAAQPPVRSVEGRAQRVVDGDTLWFAPDDGSAPQLLRLVGIDAPEICQPWGPEARAALQELVQGQPLRLEIAGRDTYGRLLGTLYAGTRNLNRTLVQEGHAWSTRYKYDRGPYVADERMAKALGRGFNRAGDAVMPRDFRREHGPCFDAGAASAAGGAAAAAPAAAAPPPAGANTATPYRCDGRTRCAQMSSCAEATWFLRNCPGVQMDANRDGVPCERQWCRP